ncbi:MAG: hypothetical protein ACLTYW_00015 [Collinsella sp.]
MRRDRESGQDVGRRGPLRAVQVLRFAQVLLVLDANHVKLDLELPARASKTNGQWMYNEDWQESAKCPGLLVPTGSKGTSTTGTCDAIYSDPISSPGLRELLCFGYLWGGSMCGAFCGLRTRLGSTGELWRSAIWPGGHHGLAMVRGEAQARGSALITLPGLGGSRR